MSRTLLARSLVFVVATAALVPASNAEDVAKKWRLGLSLGGFNSTDEIDSNSRNVFQTVNPCVRTTTCPVDEIGFEVVTGFFADPRNDSAAFGSLGVEASAIGTFTAQYAVNSIFVIEGSVGYQTGEIGDVEVSAQFAGDEPPIEEIAFNFRTYHVPVGDLTRIPIQLTALSRFRPRARFNPYVGGGIGYDINGFQPSAELNDLSSTLDSLKGRQMRVTDNGGIVVDGGEAAPFLGLSGATVDVHDSFTWHLAAGAEFSVKKNWALFADFRWIDASREFAVSFNGSSELGRSMPNLTDYDDSPAAQASYGPMQIQIGGLIDAGQLLFIPKTTSSPTTDCGKNPGECELTFVLNEEFATRLPADFVPNGENDPGQYYVQGGHFSYDGYALQIGFRYTFK